MAQRAFDGLPIERLATSFCRHGRGERLGIAIRADDVEREPRIRAVRQKLRILADQSLPPANTPAGHRLTNAHPKPPLSHPVSDRSRDHGLAHLRISACYEEARNSNSAKHSKF